MDFRKIKSYFNFNRLLFIPVFVAIFLVSSMINFSPVLGAANQQFTLSQFFGPIAGAFLGPLFGAISILGAQLISYFTSGKAFDWVNIFRLAPMLFAAYYFGRKDSKLIAVVPLMCMALFMIHPIGAQVWYYSLYWLIPIIAAVFFSDRLIAKSFGATFSAHAIGGTIFLYTIPTNAALWQMLIPVVAFERTMFALGITFSYLAMNTFLSKVEHMLPEKALEISRKYVLGRNILKLGA